MNGKQLLLWVMAACLTGGTALHAQTDVTDAYLKNPSFEADNPSSLSAVNNDADGLRGYTLTNPTGWTISGTTVTELLITKDCYTDNNFGLATSIADGNYAYYLRMGWSTGYTSVKQNVKLPAGNYRLSVSQRSGYANSAFSSLALMAWADKSNISFTKGSTGCFTSMAWTTSTLDFTLTDEMDIPIGFEITWVSGGSCVMLDNVRLYRLPDDYQEPEDPTEEEVTSFTEGVITGDFVAEAEMKGDLLQMLANFAKYMKNDYHNVDGTYGYFNGESSGQSNEAGVRTNADLSMICAFLVKYGKEKVTLPSGVTWSDLESMAKKSLAWAYGTHKANKLRQTTNNAYWGSTSTSDNVWESSLWAMSVAYSAFFQWDKLNDTQKKYIYQLLKAECNYELYRNIPTGYAGDTKAEENGWEADVLAATLGLFPDDELAPKWFERLREFAINSYSHSNDATNTTVIDEWYDGKTVADLYKGQNLYNDYSIQNHNLFHTSYQNVVMQELGEAALALKMFQLGVNGKEKWKTNALMHNNQEVQDNILNWLALADGELAMPNGNDWSLFLYDQITSYSTQACFQSDPNALMLENMAYKYIKARQKTTTDGSWLLRPDVGARRMGVEAHRVMMTYLMHEMLPTAELTPTKWEDFNARYSEAKMIPDQNVVRAATDSRFTCFSWSNGLKSYTGYFAANSPDKNKIVVPYRANNTGNLLGWYEVQGKSTDASPVVSGNYQLEGNGYVMNGELNTNGATLNNCFAIYSTPQNALIYLDYVTANEAVTITAEKGGMLAISTDELMKTMRTLYYNKKDGIAHKQLDGATFTSFESNWVNIDNELGVVSVGNGKKIAFGDRGANNSIYTSKLYPMYAAENRAVAAGAVVDARNLVYYSLVDAKKTQELAQQVISLKADLPEGWNGVIAPDADRAYFLLSHFKGSTGAATLNNLQYDGKAPVFYSKTTITDSKSSATFNLAPNQSTAQPFRLMVQGSSVEAQLDNDSTAYITALSDAAITVSIALADQSGYATHELAIPKGKTFKVYLKNNKIYTIETAIPTPTDVTDQYMTNADFSEGPVTTANIRGYGKDMTTGEVYSMQPVTGWTAGESGITDEKGYKNSAQGGGVFAYGSSNQFKGNNKSAPATNPQGTKTGNCLGIFGVWSAANCHYYQEVTLEPGTYTISVPVYNSNTGTKYTSSLTGFIADDGTTHTAPVNVANGSWQTASTTFKLAKATHGKISIGYNAAQNGSADAPHLFFDKITITYIPMPEETRLGATIKEAQAIPLDNVGEAVFQIPSATGEALSNAIATAQEVHEQEHTTSDAIANAQQTLENAVKAVREATLNTPDPNMRYYLKVATTDHARQNNAVAITGDEKGYTLNASITDPQPFLAQALIFTQVEGNSYHICQERPEGIVYLTYGSDEEERTITATTDEANKGTFLIDGHTATANIFNILNTLTNTTIACQNDGTLHTKSGNADFSLTEAPQATVTIDITPDLQYTTCIFPFTPALPEGIIAYNCQETQGTQLILEEEATPRANTPYILFAEDGCTDTYLMGWGTADAESYTAGLLTGVYVSTTAIPSTYTLQQEEGKAAFCIIKEDQEHNIAPYQAYLTVPKSEETAFYFKADESDPTGISSVSVWSPNNWKSVHATNGMPLNKPQKGINIVKTKDGQTRKIIMK